MRSWINTSCFRLSLLYLVSITLGYKTSQFFTCEHHNLCFSLMAFYNMFAHKICIFQIKSYKQTVCT